MARLPFGIGGNRSPRNEHGFPIVDPAAPPETGGPLPGMLSMRLGDPLEGLPPEARQKYEMLKTKSDDAHLLLVATIEAQQELRVEIQRDETTIRRLQMHQHQGGFNLPTDAPQVVAEQKKLDRKRDDMRRLNAKYEAHSAVYENASSLAHNIMAAIRARPGGTVGRMISNDPPALKKGEAIVDAIEARRRRQRELESDLAKAQTAPVPSSVVKARMRQQIKALAEAGRPNAVAAVEHGIGEIIFPVRTNRVQILNTPDPGAIGFLEQPDPLAMVSWLLQDQLVAALDREIEAVSDDQSALDDKARAEKVEEVLSDRLAVEFEEVALIEAAALQGIPIEFRPATDVRALLGLTWVVAPAPPHPTGGQAGVIRRLGS